MTTTVDNDGGHNRQVSTTDDPALADAVVVAREITESVLFPNALATDRSPIVSESNLDALAAAGLYGLFGPTELGGFAADLATAGAVVEELASGCMTTALVWLQHHGLVGNLLFGPDELRQEWLADMCTGARRAGIVFAGLLPGPSSLHATPRTDGWTINGTAPWVSGWGRINTLQVAARGPENTVVTVALDDLDTQPITTEAHHLSAMNASATVKLSFDDVRVPADRVLSVVDHDPAASGGLSLRLNGSLALGVVRRCAQLIGPSGLDEQLVAARQQLDSAGSDEMALARAAACALASRAAAQLLVHTGSRSIEIDNHAQRLAREAMFLLVFGSRPAIKAALLERL